jgi:hypothetical protein
VIQLEPAKEIWDKMVNDYEGNYKVKLAKFQALRIQFESIRMSKYDNVAIFILKVDETVNTIKGLIENIEEVVVVQKVLRSLPSIFDSKVFVIE